MKKLEIADHEIGSDQGNLRYYPKGRFIKSMLERSDISISAKPFDRFWYKAISEVLSKYDIKTVALG